MPGPHDFAGPRPSSKKPLDEAWYQSRRSFSEGGSVPFVLRTGRPLTSCLGLRPPCAPTLPASTASCPTFRDDRRNAPLHRGRDGQDNAFDSPDGAKRAELRYIGTTGNLRMTPMCRLPVGHRPARAETNQEVCVDRAAHIVNKPAMAKKTRDQSQRRVRLFRRRL